MQTQDVKYITMKKTIEANKIRRMQSELHMTDVVNTVKNTHILFNDSNEKDIDLAERFNTHPAMLNRRPNRPRLDDLNNMSISDADVEVNDNASKTKIQSMFALILYSLSITVRLGDSGMSRVTHFFPLSLFSARLQFSQVYFQ